METVPKGVYGDLTHIDKLLTKLIADVPDLDKAELITRVVAIHKAKRQMVSSFFDQPVYGLKFSFVFLQLDCLDSLLNTAALQKVIGVYSDSVIADYIKGAQKCKERLETKLHEANPPTSEKVSITESDTWAHNPDIGKSNVCINVKTTPPQAFISASLAGPGNYKASLPKTPLHPDGTRQVGATITQAGSYTDTLIVYDKSGTQTATSTNTVNVAPPPQNGPTPAFGPACPKPTQ